MPTQLSNLLTGTFQDGPIQQGPTITAPRELPGAVDGGGIETRIDFPSSTETVVGIITQRFGEFSPEPRRVIEQPALPPPELPPELEPEVVITGTRPPPRPPVLPPPTGPLPPPAGDPTLGFVPGGRFPTPPVPNVPGPITAPPAGGAPLPEVTVRASRGPATGPRVRTVRVGGPLGGAALLLGGVYLFVRRQSDAALARELRRAEAGGAGSKTPGGAGPQAGSFAEFPDPNIQGKRTPIRDALRRAFRDLLRRTERTLRRDVDLSDLDTVTVRGTRTNYGRITFADPRTGRLDAISLAQPAFRVTPGANRLRDFIGAPGITPTRLPTPTTRPLPTPAGPATRPRTPTTPTVPTLTPFTPQLPRTPFSPLDPFLTPSQRPGLGLAPAPRATPGCKCPPPKKERKRFCEEGFYRANRQGTIRYKVWKREKSCRPSKSKSQSRRAPQTRTSSTVRRSNILVGAIS